MNNIAQRPTVLTYDELVAIRNDLTGIVARWDAKLRQHHKIDHTPWTVIAIQHWFWFNPTNIVKYYADKCKLRIDNIYTTGYIKQESNYEIVGSEKDLRKFIFRIRNYCNRTLWKQPKHIKYLQRKNNA